LCFNIEIEIFLYFYIWISPHSSTNFIIFFYTLFWQWIHVRLIKLRSIFEVFQFRCEWRSVCLINYLVKVDSFQPNMTFHFLDTSDTKSTSHINCKQGWNKVLKVVWTFFRPKLEVGSTNQILECFFVFILETRFTKEYFLSQTAYSPPIDRLAMATPVHQLRCVVLWRAADGLGWFIIIYVELAVTKVC